MLVGSSEITVIDESIDGLLHVVPKGAKPVVLRVVLDVTPDVGTLIQRHAVAHRPLKDALERLGFGPHGQILVRAKVEVGQPRSVVPGWKPLEVDWRLNST